MSYETVIDQVKKLSEQSLLSVSAFIKLLEAEQHEVFIEHAKSKNKQAFFSLAGKIHLDRNSVIKFREESML